MKMSSVISQALITRTTHSSLLANRLAVSLKHRHTVAEGTLIEIDLETSNETGESSAVRIVRLEDLMHTIMAQRSAPSWIPFIPGSSYWVPPKPSPKKVANLLNKFSLGPALSVEEAMSLTTVRGWPSSVHLLRGFKLVLPLAIVLVTFNKSQTQSEVRAKLKDSKTAKTEVQAKVVDISNNEED